MTIIYALKIASKFRVATKDVILDEEFSDQTVSLYYRPAILRLTPIKDELSLEQGGTPAVPTSQVSIADPERLYFSFLQSKRIDEIEVEYLRVEDRTVTQRILLGIGEFKYANGVLDLDLRAAEDIVDREYMTPFTPVTFQWIEIPNVVDVDVQPTFSKLPDVPWQIVGADYRRAYIYAGKWEEWTTYVEDQPKFGLTPVGVDPDLAYPFDSGSSSWKRDEQYPRLITNPGTSRSYDRLPIDEMYRPYYALDSITYDGMVGTSVLRKTGGAFEFDDVSLMYPRTGLTHPEALFENTASYYYDFINNIFIQNYGGIYVPGYMPAYGEDVPMVNGSLRLLDKGNNTRTSPGYRYAHVGSAIKGNFEIIAYCVAGAGCMWKDDAGSGAYFWRSGGQINALASPNNPIDRRMYHLSGIPTTVSDNPLSFMSLPTPTPTGYGFKRLHNLKEPVWAAETGPTGSGQTPISLFSTYDNTKHTFDRLLIKSNNFTPDPTLDPEYSAGFIYTGQKGSSLEWENFFGTDDGGGQIPVTRPVVTDYKLFNRYKIRSLTEDVYDLRILQDSNESDDALTAPFTLIELQIHNRHLDSDNDYAISIPTNEASAEIPDPGDWRINKWNSEDQRFEIKPNKTFSPYSREDDLRELKVELYQLDYYVGKMTLALNGIDADTITYLASEPEFAFSLKNRYRGLRVDQVLDAEQLKTDVASAIVYSTGTGGEVSAGLITVEEQSANIINNATQRFAVCKESSVRFDSTSIPGSTLIFEDLYFHIPDEAGYKRPIIDENVDENPDTVQTRAFEDAKKAFKLYTNKMSWRPTFNTVNDQKRTDGQVDYGASDAEQYFRRSMMRIIHDPVPQNSDDLGKYFPIVYGRVKRAPLMQVISKISLYEDQETAGDDIYIYASHPCEVFSGHDIIVEYEVETPKTQIESEEQQKERQRSGLASSIAKSPFPSYEDGHVQIDAQDKRLPRQRLWLPYHALVEKEAIDGRKYYGIRLRGSEWRSEAGKADKRYPIRNGFGNTDLFWTGGGWFDNYGEILGYQGLIEHPSDVIRHFIKNYGKQPYNEQALDESSCIATKSVTPLYRASIFMNEPMSTPEFLQEMMKQFGLYLGRRDGKIYLFYPDDQLLLLTKPIIDRLNVVSDIRETSDGYKTSVTEVIYKYNYDYKNSKCQDVIYLNAENNEYLSLASRALQNRVPLEIEAKWVNDHTTATLVAQSLARIHSRKRRYFELTIQVVEGILPKVGDIVPLTSERHLLHNAPCFVIEVDRPENGLVNLKLISFDLDQVSTQTSRRPIVTLPLGPPENIVAPVVTGDLTEGSVLSCTTGTWSNL